MRSAWLAAAGAVCVAAALGGCSECAGTPSCDGEPEASASAQVINHKSGAPVAGVRVRFVRTGGVETTGDTAYATTDDDGYFTLRLGSVYIGPVIGTLTFTPPAPLLPHEAPDVSFATSRRRGDGVFLGRFVADPFFILIGEVHRSGIGPIAGATVTMRRVSGGRLASDSHVVVSEGGGRFGWIDPPVVEPGPMQIEFEVSVPGEPVYRETQTVPMQYMDGAIGFVIIVVPEG